MRKSIALLAAAMMATSLGTESVPYVYKSKVIEPIWVRKKCKTCKSILNFIHVVLSKSIKLRWIVLVKIGNQKLSNMSWEKCNVVMLPTINENRSISQIYKFIGKPVSIFDKRITGELIRTGSPNKSEYQCQHLYITSDEDDEEIREGDYCIGSDELFGPYEEVDILIKPSYKIIASTDSSLGVPLIPRQSINSFIEQYNKGTVIKEVLVEYEEYEKDEEWSELRLKVNPDGAINIKFPKDSFSREEVIELLHRYERDMTYFGRDSYYKGCFPKVTDDWANENLY